ncbi:restriction endonuclease subunit S [Vibrio diabolicus]|uniref:restriction endonuclease subunit S n=1 Tax=Vibrio diabolicus TaxID=50719 RepID=UPI0037523208
MTGRYKAYPEYKDSGIEWVGDIPKDWSMWKLAHAFNEIGSGTTPPTSNEEWFKGDIPWITTGELREKVIVDTKKKLTKDTLKAFPTLRKYPVGSVAIAMYGATIGRLGIFGIEATTNQACCVMTHSKQINNKYLFYWLWAFKEDIIRLSSGGGQPNINQEKVASLRVSAPVSKEQQKIANFLDHETAKIDTLITKQEKLIELLKEKRQAVIAHAVTKGLNPDAQMKDSGVEWVGKIPASWSMWKLSHAFNEIGSGTTPPTNNEKWFDGNIHWITTGELREKVITDTKKKLTEDTLKIFPTLRKYPVGSIAIAMYGATIGRLGILGVEATTNQACCVMTTSTQLDNNFLFYWLGAYREEIIKLSSGGGQPNINQEKVASLRVSAPLLKEQQKIVKYLDHEIAKIDVLTDKQELAIKLMKERKTALISAAVTGKIDVRDWQGDA